MVLFRKVDGETIKKLAQVNQIWEDERSGKKIYCLPVHFMVSPSTEHPLPADSILSPSIHPSLPPLLVNETQPFDG
jgi:hypothetical protein